MKRLVTVLGFVCLFGSHAALAVTKIPSPVKKILIPKGFDSNDRVVFVVAGEYADTCFRVADVEYETDHVKKEIVITPYSYDYTKESPVCNEVITPFIQEVNVGILPEGKYTVRLAGDTQIETETVIKPTQANAPADDYQYAPVQSAYLVVDRATGTQKITLIGQFPQVISGCMVMDRVLVQEAPKEVLVVQPIAEIISNDNDPRCQRQKESFFRFTSKLKRPFVGVGGKGIMHVRVSNGAALNLLIDLGKTAQKTN